MSQLIGNSGELGWVVLKAFLLYLTAIIGFRIGDRRTLAEMSPYDFVAAVAVGPIVGRVPNSDTTSYLAGAATLVTLLVVHRCITALRHFPGVAQLVDPSPRLLVAQGQVINDELRRCGLTLDDLHRMLRQDGLASLSEARFVILEARGQVSIIRHTKDNDDDPELVHDIMKRSDGGCAG